MRDFEKIRSQSLMTECGLRWLETFAQSVTNLDGDVIELGVYRGGSTLLLSNIFPDKKIHLYDTFEGFPQTSEHDNTDAFSTGGMNETSLEYVRDEVLAGRDNLVFHKGFFPDTFDLDDSVKFCMAIYDGDLYSGCRDFLRLIYPRMVSGGIIFIDDYGNNPFFRGATTATNEFLNENSLVIATIKCLPQEIGVIKKCS